MSDNPPSPAFTPSRIAAVPLFPAESPLRSSTGALLITFRQAYETYPGLGFSAAWTSTGAPGLATPSPPPQPPALPPSSGQDSSPSRRVTSTADLRAALADPRVQSIVLAAHVALAGRDLVVASPGPQGRSLTIASDASACAGPANRAAASGHLVLPGICTLDAGGASGVLRASGPGLSLSLERLAFLGGAALLGGALRVSDGAAVSAADCLFANCSSVGDGGAVFASGAGTALQLTRCATPTSAAPLAHSRRMSRFRSPRKRLPMF